MYSYYADRQGVTWYICSRCNNKERGKPKVCPVCGEVEGAEQAARTNAEANARLDNALQQLESIMKKYGGNI